MEQRLDRIAGALERIADALEAVTVVPMGHLPVVDEVPEPSCPHPESARVNFGSMGALEEWECARHKGGCGYRYRGARFIEPDAVLLAQAGD